MKKPLPIGVDNFEDIRKEGYYYVDKTLLIKELMDLKGKVNLFIRPRRKNCAQRGIGGSIAMGCILSEGL